MFKASDYRISPFELESVLIEHPAVAEAAVVPAPDPLRLAVPKAYRGAGRRATAGPRDGAVDLPHLRERLAPFKRVRRLEFAELPKTISGKIRRVELRQMESSPAPPRVPASQRSSARRIFQLATLISRGPAATSPPGRWRRRGRPGYTAWRSPCR